jgi:hypothetical protein
VFGPAHGVPLDGNAKARIKAFVQGYNGRYRQEGQHRGPITRAYMEVLQALLWGFHNSKTGLCFPSYEGNSREGKMLPRYGLWGDQGAGGRWKLDRLSRSLKDVLHIMERIGNAGAGFRSITESIDTTTPAGRMMMQMVGAFAGQIGRYTKTMVENGARPGR